MAVWEVTGINSNGTDLTYAIRLEKEPNFAFRVSINAAKKGFVLRFPIMELGQREMKRKIFAKTEEGKRVEIKRSSSLKGDFPRELSTLEELVGRYRVPFFI